MTKRRQLLGLAGATLAAGLLATSALAQDVSLKLHQFLPAQANVPNLILKPWLEQVEENSGGSIDVEMFSSMALGGTPPQLMDQAIDGVADVIWTVVGYTPGRFPSTEVFELPFMMTDARAASRAYWQMFEKHMEDTEFADVKILGTWVHGPGLFHTNKPVAHPDDLKGLKIRGGSRTVNTLLEKTGATPVGMPVPAVPEGLSKGVIDGTTIPWEVTAALKVPELVDNHTEFEGEALYTLTFVLAMNKQVWESLTPEQQKAIDDASGEEFSVFAGGTQADADGPSRELALDNGNNIITVAGDDLAAWKAAVEPIYDEWVADMNSRGIDGQALIDEARALIDEYDG